MNVLARKEQHTMRTKYLPHSVPALWFGLLVFVFLSVSGESLTEAKPSSQPSKRKVSWHVHKRVKLLQGTYQLESGKRYAMVGHIVKGRVSVVDLQTGKATTKAWGVGQVYIAQQGSYGVVALTSMRQLLLVSLPSLKVLRRHKVKFYPYGVSFEVTRSQPASAPAKKALPRYVVVADQMGGSLLRFDLQTGKIAKKRSFRWPIRSRWSATGGVMIPLSGPPLWLHPKTWKPEHTWKLPGVIGDVSIQGNLLALAYGDSKRQQGALHLYQDLRKQRWRVPTKARPRGVVQVGPHILTLTEKGWFQVFNKQDGRLLQTQRLSNSGLTLRCGQARQCVGLLPLAHTLVILQR